MDLALDLDLDGARLRTLTVRDAALVVEATSGETGRAVWGARPVGSYSLVEAQRALGSWELSAERRTSYGFIEGGRLVGAVGLMLDGLGSAELAYWVRPEERRRGVAWRMLRLITEWVHGNTGMTRLWLEVDPDNVASQLVARKAGYRFEERLPGHCRSWLSDDPAHDSWHDCLIWVHTA